MAGSPPSARRSHTRVERASGRRLAQAACDKDNAPVSAAELAAFERECHTSQGRLLVDRQPPSSRLLVDRQQPRPLRQPPRPGSPPPINSTAGIASVWAAHPERFIWPFTGDKGSCALPRTSMYFTYWGLTTPYSFIANTTPRMSSSTFPTAPPLMTSIPRWICGLTNGENPTSTILRACPCAEGVAHIF